MRRADPATESTSAVACPLCEARGAVPAVVGYDRFRATAGEYPYVRCAGCGLLRRDPLPAESEIAGLYPDDYAPHVDAPRVRPDKWINRMAVRYHYGTASAGEPALLRWVFRQASRRVMRHLRAPHGKNRLLDVGCGAGSLLLSYRRLGWTVAGVEPSPEAAARANANGFPVHQGTVFDAPYAPESFDVVILSHVIEHVLDPVGVLRRCGELLAPGGIVSLVTPNADAVGLRLFGSCWFSLDAPRHLTLFDPATIRLAAERAGLVARRVATPAVSRMFAESRHYAATQGRALPDDLDERRRVIEESIRAKREHRAFRRLVGPAGELFARFGRGEFLEAELAAGP